MKTYEPSQATFWQETELPLTSSRAGSRVKTSALLENKLDLEKEREAVSGLKSSDLLASYDRATSSWRTSQICLVALAKGQADGLAEFSETWPSAGMMRNGKTYRRQPLARHMLGKEYGLLPTLGRNEGKGASRKRYRNSPHFRGAKMAEALRTSIADPIYLNPCFAELAMGFPIGWTDLQHSETP